MIQYHTCTRGWPLRGCSSWQEHWRPLPSQSLQAWSHPSSSPTSSVALSPWLWFTVTTSLIKISPVQHSVLVAIADTLQELPQIRFHLEGRHVWCQATQCSYRRCKFEGEVAVGGWLYQDLVTGVTRKLKKNLIRSWGSPPPLPPWLFSSLLLSSNNFFKS